MKVLDRASRGAAVNYSIQPCVGDDFACSVSSANKMPARDLKCRLIVFISCHLVAVRLGAGDPPSQTHALPSSPSRFT
jgi:hypothetical protein